MFIFAICPQCGKQRTPDSRDGEAILCTCGAPMTVPSADSPIGPDASSSPPREGSPSITSAASMRPRELTTAVILYLAAYVPTLLSLVWGAMVIGALPVQPEISFMGIPVAMALAYIGVCVICRFLWIGRNWARITMIALMSLNIAIFVWLLTQDLASLVFVPYLLSAVRFIEILNMRQTKEYCRGRRRRAASTGRPPARKHLGA